MPRMSPAELATWEERFDYDDLVWKKKGLSGGQDADTEGWEGIEAYRGESGPDDGWGSGTGGPDDAIDVVRVPMTFTVVNTMEAQLLARDPNVRVFPRRKEEEIFEKARKNEVFIRYNVEELDFRREWKRALHSALTIRFGAVLHGYTPDIRKTTKDGDLIEYFDAARPDFPYIRYVPPWDIRIDPAASSLRPDQDARYMRHRILLDKDQFDNDPLYKSVRGGVEPTKTVDMRLVKPTVRDTAQEGPDLTQRIEVWHVYDKVEHKWFGWSPGARGKLVFDPDDWPTGISDEGLPYSYLAFNDQADDIFPITYEMMIRPQVAEMNKLRTIMQELAKRIRRLVLLNPENIAEEDAENMLQELGLKEIILAKGGNLDNAIRDVALGTFPQELFLLESRIRDDIREIVGQSNFARAQRENVETAFEAGRIALGDETQTGRNVEEVDRFVAHSVRRWWQGVQRLAQAKILPNDFLVPILGEDDARSLEAGMAEITREEIQGEFDVRIVGGSTGPKNEAQERADAVAVFEIMSKAGERVILDQALIDVLLAFGRNPSKYLQTAPERAATGAAQPVPAAGSNGTEQPALPPQTFLPPGVG